MHHRSAVPIIAGCKNVGTDHNKIEPTLKLQGDGIVGIDVGDVVGVEGEYVNYGTIIVAEVQYRGALELWELIDDRVHRIAPSCGVALHDVDGRRRAHGR